MSKYDEVKIKFWITNSNNLPIYNFKIYTKLKKFNKISGHRFVNLVDFKNPYQNDAEMILQFIERMPFLENDYMKCGKILENPVIYKATEIYELDNVKHDYGFEDLKNGTKDFYFMRDLMFEKDGVECVGEVKTFFNKAKIGLGKDNIYPPPHISWWLQTRLEVELLDVCGKIFYYYVTPTTKTAILKDRPFSVQAKYLFESDYIEPTTKDEDVIVDYFKEKGITTFKQVMNLALERREEIMTLYEDDEGTFYFASVPVKELFYNGSDHVLRFIESIENKIQVEEIRNG